MGGGEGQQDGTCPADFHKGIVPCWVSRLQRKLTEELAKQSQQTGARNSNHLAHAWVNDGTDLKIWQLTEMVTERNGPEVLVKAEGKQT